MLEVFAVICIMIIVVVAVLLIFVAGLMMAITTICDAINDVKVKRGGKSGKRRL